MYIYPISFLGSPEINLLAKKLRTAISLAISLICCSPLAVSIELSIIILIIMAAYVSHY